MTLAVDRLVKPQHKRTTQTKNLLTVQLLEPHYLDWMRGHPSVIWSVDGRVTPFMSPDNEGQSVAGRLSPNDRQTVATLYRSPNPKHNGGKIVTWHLRQKKDRPTKEKQPNSGTKSADCLSIVALFWPHRHRPLVGLEM